MNDEFKYTPGPWEVKPEEVHVDYIRIRGTEPGRKYKIANALCVSGDPIDPREARSNARLIAKSPLLLEALKNTIKAWEKGEDIAGAMSEARRLIKDLEES